MMTKYFVDQQGKFLGGFSGSAPEGGIEIDLPPDHAFKLYRNGEWIEPEGFHVIKRQGEYPPAGDQLDAEFKARQKRKMLVGKAREALASGDKDAVIIHLLEAIEPTEEQNTIDGKIQSVKNKNPKIKGE